MSKERRHCEARSNLQSFSSLPYLAAFVKIKIASCLAMTTFFS
jgi:hypothetical protein